MSVIYALWLRQIKRYLRSRSRIIGALGQPLLFLFALGFGLGPVFQKAGHGSYITFLVPGVIAQSILFTSVFSGIEIIWDKQFGFLKETLVAPVSRLQIVIGRTLGGATVAVFQGLIVFVLSFLFGFRLSHVFLLPLTLIFMVLIAILFTSLGTVIASIVEDMQGFQLIMNFLVMPLYFLSGALFPLQGVPALFKLVASIDPLSYGVDGLRATLSLVSAFGLAHDIAVLSVITLALISLASYLFSRIQL